VLNRQYYQITQGPKSMSIMLDRATNMTSVWPNLTMAGLPTPYTGLPNGVMYTTGSIAELRGPDRIAGAVMPAIEEYHKALIAAHDDIVIQGDLTCDNFYNNNDVLGIYSTAGAVRIGNLAPDNLNLDAFVMACGTANGEIRVDNFDVGSPRGSVNLRGGCVSKFFGAFYTFDANGTVLTGYARNFHYDRRGVIPPSYPTVVNFRVSTPTARTLVWREI
jgi:hypothetical protein